MTSHTVAAWSWVGFWNMELDLARGERWMVPICRAVRVVVVFSVTPEMTECCPSSAAGPAAPLPALLGRVVFLPPPALGVRTLEPPPLPAPFAVVAAAIFS